MDLTKIEQYSITTPNVAKQKPKPQLLIFTIAFGEHGK